MRRQTSLLSAVGILCSIMGAQAQRAPDEAKLRKLVVLPGYNFSISAYINDDGYEIRTEEPVSTPDPEALLKTLKGDASDADRYTQLARAYKSDHTEEAKAAWAKAAELYRVQLAADPKNISLIVKLADALDLPGTAEEAEKLLREALKSAPNAPESAPLWDELGIVIGSTAGRQLLGSKAVNFETNGDMSGMVALLREVKITPAQMQAVRDRLHEARQAFDKAIAVAPTQSLPYLARAKGRGQTVFADAISGTLGQTSFLSDEEITKIAQQAAMVQFQPESTQDMLEASRLEIKDVSVIAGGAVTYLLARALILKNFNLINGAGILNDCPASDQKKIQEILPRLEKAASGTGVEAARAARWLGLVQWLALGQAKAVPTLNRAIALAPEEPLGKLLLMRVLLSAKRYEEALPILEEQVRRNPTVRNRLMLAKAYDKLGRDSDELTQIEAAQKLAPEGFAPALAQAAYLIKHADTPEKMEAAGKSFLSAASLYKPERDGEQYQEYVTDGILYNALQGQLDQAREQAKQLAEAYKDDENVKALVAALNP